MPMGAHRPGRVPARRGAGFDVITVVEAVAEAEDADPLDLDPPFGAVVDVDRLCRFVNRADGDSTATVHYRGWRIDITEGEGITLTDPSDAK